MSIIAQTSANLMQKIKDICGDYLREVAEHPGQWDESSITRLVRNPPAVYVAWLGQMPSPRPNAVIYQVVEALTAGLHKSQIAPSGFFELQSVQNLWSDTQSGMGVAVYGMYFNALQPLPDPTDTSTLDDFIEYHHQFNQSQNPERLDDKTKLTVILPKQGE